METHKEYLNRVTKEYEIRKAWETLMQAVTIKEVLDKPDTGKITKKLQEVGLYLKCNQ